MPEDEPPVRFSYEPVGERPGHLDEPQRVTGDLRLMMDGDAGPFWDDSGLLGDELDELSAMLGLSRTTVDEAMAWAAAESALQHGPRPPQEQVDRLDAQRYRVLRRLRAEVEPEIRVSQGFGAHEHPELLHVAYASHWTEAQRTGVYPWSTRGMTYAEVGFVHCAEPDQVSGVLKRFYADVDEPLVLLRLDRERLAEGGVAVRWEPVPDGDAFPHLVAPLDPAYVVEVTDLP